LHWRAKVRDQALRQGAPGRHRDLLPQHRAYRQFESVHGTGHPQALQAREMRCDTGFDGSRVGVQVQHLPQPRQHPGQHRRQGGVDLRIHAVVFGDKSAVRRPCSVAPSWGTDSVRTMDRPGTSTRSTPCRLRAAKNPSMAAASYGGR